MCLKAFVKLINKVLLFMFLFISFNNPGQNTVANPVVNSQHGLLFPQREMVISQRSSALSEIRGGIKERTDVSVEYM